MTALIKNLMRPLKRFTIDFKPVRKNWLNGFYWRTKAFESGWSRFRFFEIATQLLKFDDGWSLKLAGLGGYIYLKLPFLKIIKEPDDILDSYGFCFGGLTEGGLPTDLVLEWGPGKRKSIYMPWMWTFHKHEVRDGDGNWIPASNSYPPSDNRHKETYPYRYVCRDGEVQGVNAEVYAERREWRWKALKSLPWPSVMETCISVNFDSSVGEGRGSWKGGVIGTSHKLLPNESMEESLRRMEKTIRFER